jgi:pimeloyl-ACP methyl ester carboxylesterase
LAGKIVPEFVTNDSTTIHVDIVGDGPPLLLIPGLGASSRAWGSFPKAMSAYFRVITYDPRGFGASPASPGSITMETMVSDITCVLDGLEIPEAHLFGVSMGGILALRFLARYPTRATRLVLISTPSRMTPWARKMLDLFEIMARKLTPGEFVTMMAALSMSPATLARGGSRARDLERALLPDEVEMENILAQVAAVRSLGKESLPDNVGIPTLVISGKSDFLTPPAQARELSEAIETSELFSLEGGHACLMENSDEGVVRILSFLLGKTPRP